MVFFACVLTVFFAPAYYLNLRFGGENPQRVRIIRSLRESLLAGLYLSLCAWLQMTRVLNWTNALVIFGILALLESFLLVKG